MLQPLERGLVSEVSSIGAARWRAHAGRGGLRRPACVSCGRGNWAASVHCAARFHHAANTHPQPETNLVSSNRLPQLTGWATWAESLREECRSRVVNSVSAPILYLRIGAI